MADLIFLFILTLSDVKFSLSKNVFVLGSIILFSTILVYNTSFTCLTLSIDCTYKRFCFS
jgi:hypothetical protein